MSGAGQHITRDEELSRRHDRRRYAAERQHEPVTNLGWELLDACPVSNPEQRSDQATFQIVARTR
jgi:hypothetical protein